MEYHSPRRCASAALPLSACSRPQLHMSTSGRGHVLQAMRLDCHVMHTGAALQQTEEPSGRRCRLQCRSQCQLLQLYERAALCRLTRMACTQVDGI